jgi:hypothetical protein
MRFVGTPGGAPCPGVTPRPWTRNPHSWLMTFVTVWLSQRSASSTLAAVQPAISGVLALSRRARPVWTSAHASQPPAHARRPLRWGPPFSQPGVITPPGGPSNCWRSYPHAPVGALLRRNGLVPRKRRRRLLGHPGTQAPTMSAPQTLASRSPRSAWGADAGAARHASSRATRHNMAVMTAGLVP